MKLLKIVVCLITFVALSGLVSPLRAQHYPNQWDDYGQPLIAHADSIIKVGKSISQEDARMQAAQNVGPVKLNLLPKKGEKQQTTPELYCKVAEATVVLTDVCLCDNLHVFPAT
ncbi:hypothetical protein [Mangrovibacterium lignilyticum]|uniref:hypothetical protein n=1 Tax=Mangrovibacterium lignilyticum TaxID=2668052 RepID=UPI0013D8DB93|nr:hypothetical protein [Mangrovibacterium lignilyticum]